MTFVVTFTLAFAIVLLLVALMAIGVINGRKPISGSCGGLAGSACELCGGTGSCVGEDQQ